MWYCHECHAEMRPQMVPYPVCASCQGTFVEKMDNPTDDPRQFTHEEDDVPVTLLDLLSGLGGPAPPRRDEPRALATSGSRRLSFQTGNGGNVTLSFGSGGGFGSGPASPIPTLADFLAAGPQPDRRRDRAEAPGIAGPLFAQYLMALLGGRAGPSLGDLGAMPGQMGDYVYNQEALDNIISQLMENSNSHRPVPASDEIMEDLPRDVLEEGSPMLEKDCAVCKDQFQANPEDPAELIVVTLPCKHPFHEPCIMPWLKSSGTCPVCRYQLVPQPEQHSSPGSPPAGGQGGSGQPGQDRSGWRNIVSSMMGGQPSPQASSSGASGGQAQNRDDRNQDREPQPPGGWN